MKAPMQWRLKQVRSPSRYSQPCQRSKVNNSRTPALWRLSPFPKRIINYRETDLAAVSPLVAAPSDQRRRCIVKSHPTAGDETYTTSWRSEEPPGEKIKGQEGERLESLESGRNKAGPEGGGGKNRHADGLQRAALAELPRGSG
ncbi:hypothetical protein EYF80_039072 [Liparis tanakae]|uniref:Uncharacterized protein n=1 Tax=Liparis tanakae TaxID=230148 RepID=A0A4Z2GBY8_9TELE|nr:hypothetical protein EYF80_039072 [Liparis tanakae]